MPYRSWPEDPGERRCVNCDQRLVARVASPGLSEPQAAGTAADTLDYVCPDDHERWMYDSRSKAWRQVY